MTSHKIDHINIKSLKPYLLSKASTKPNTITIYHFIIGAKAYEKDFVLETDQTLSNPYVRCRNHECSKIVENLLFNPEMQLSPELINTISKAEFIANTITIRQVLVLIDPVYQHRPLSVGLLSVIGDLPLDLTIEHNLEHLNVNIKSVLEPIIVSDDISEQQILEILSTLNNLRTFYPMVINIMDCSSNTCNNIYADGITDGITNTNNWIHITKPKCLIDDAQLQYIPMLTIAKELNCPYDSLFDYTKLNIRWANYKDDSHLLDKLSNDYEVNNCPYSINLYNFIVTLYKVETVEYSLASVFRLWGFTTYTKEYNFDDDFKIKCEIGMLNAKKTINFNFSKLSFFDFTTYWGYKGFRELDIFRYGYDNIIFYKFIDYFIKKYNTILGCSYLGLNPSIVDLLKIEAFEIFTTLAKYFTNDVKYLSPNAEIISVKSIKMYLEENGFIL